MKLHLRQTINGIDRYKITVNTEDELRKLFKRKVIIPNMKNIDELIIIVSKSKKIYERRYCFQSTGKIKWVTFLKIILL